MILTMTLLAHSELEQLELKQAITNTRLLTATRAEAVSPCMEADLPPHSQVPAAPCARNAVHDKASLQEVHCMQNLWHMQLEQASNARCMTANSETVQLVFNAPLAGALQGQTPLVRTALGPCSGSAELLKLPSGFGLLAVADSYCTGLLPFLFLTGCRRSS